MAGLQETDLASLTCLSSHQHRNAACLSPEIQHARPLRPRSYSTCHALVTLGRRRPHNGVASPSCYEIAGSHSITSVRTAKRHSCAQHCLYMA